MQEINMRFFLSILLLTIVLRPALGEGTPTLRGARFIRQLKDEKPVIAAEATFAPTRAPKEVIAAEATFAPTLPPKDVIAAEATFAPTLPPKDVIANEATFAPTLPPKDVIADEATFAPTGTPTGAPTRAPTEAPKDDISTETPTKPPEPAVLEEDPCWNFVGEIEYGRKKTITCDALGGMKMKDQNKLCSKFEEISSQCPGVCKIREECACVDNNVPFPVSRDKTATCEGLREMDPTKMARRCKKKKYFGHCPGTCSEECAA